MKLPQIDTTKVRKFLAGFIRENLEKAGREKVVVGLSGGIDSAVAAALAREALGPENVLAFLLPYHTTPEKDREDALQLGRLLGLNPQIIDITPMVEAYFGNFPEADRMRRGNKMARERMSILYDQAAANGALVLGTGNRTELLIGYFTKYGDGGVDLEPLGGLYKTEVVQLARVLEVPDEIIDKPPTAGLWEGQTDEGELGLTYQLLDSLLYRMLDQEYNDLRLASEGFAPETIEAVRCLVRANEHKSRPPPIPVIPAGFRL